MHHRMRWSLGQQDHRGALPGDLDVELRTRRYDGVILVEWLYAIDPSHVHSLPEVVHLGSVHAPLIVY